MLPLIRRWPKTVALLAVALAGVVAFSAPSAPPLTFPEGKRFAFTIIDDTDMTTLERVRPIYAVLEKYGLRTTKTVWVFDTNNPSHPPNLGDSLQNDEYRAFVEGLQQRGFEIAMHGVRGGNSDRQQTIHGLEEYKRLLGAYPRMHVNHSLNEENLYWGANLYALPPLRWFASMAGQHQFAGDDPASPYFWGDIAKARIQYVRRFTFSQINLYKTVPSMPYHLPNTPYVNYWFPTANGNRIIEFEALLSDENLDRLEREGGVCLVYSHLGSGSFNAGTAVNPRFEARIKAIAARQGWFVPASQILDFLVRQPSWTGDINWRERIRTDVKFLAQRLSLG